MASGVDMSRPLLEAASRLLGRVVAPAVVVALAVAGTREVRELLGEAALAALLAERAAAAPLDFAPGAPAVAAIAAIAEEVTGNGRA